MLLVTPPPPPPYGKFRHCRSGNICRTVVTLMMESYEIQISNVKRIAAESPRVTLMDSYRDPGSLLIITSPTPPLHWNRSGCKRERKRDTEKEKEKEDIGQDYKLVTHRPSSLHFGIKQVCVCVERNRQAEGERETDGQRQRERKK